METYDDGESLRRGETDDGRERERRKREWYWPEAEIDVQPVRVRQWIWPSCQQPVHQSTVFAQCDWIKKGFVWMLWQSWLANRNVSGGFISGWLDILFGLAEGTVIQHDDELAQWVNPLSLLLTADITANRVNLRGCSVLDGTVKLPSSVRYIIILMDLMRRFALVDKLTALWRWALFYWGQQGALWLLAGIPLGVDRGWVRHHFCLWLMSHFN